MGSAARLVAIDALVAIEDDDAYANLALPPRLERSDLSSADRGLVTDLVYGTIRRRRALDHLIDGFLHRDVTPDVRAALRIGAYQLRVARTPTHAAVDATVGAVKGPAGGLVNAVLRRLADPGFEPVWPDLATELSYPDWVVERLTADHGADRARALLVAMNEAPRVWARDDGYVQDAASQAVVAELPASSTGSMIDLCAAPGGKATGWATRRGGPVLAADLHPSRAQLVAENAKRTHTDVPVVVADGRRAPFRPGSAAAVLVDAPCSGLGSLRRRPDARWRVEADAPERLADLQVELLHQALDLVRPDGVVVYSVCTLTRAEGPEVVDRVAAERPVTVKVPDGWERFGSAGFRPPSDEGDGMILARLRPGG